MRATSERVQQYDVFYFALCVLNRYRYDIRTTPLPAHNTDPAPSLLSHQYSLTCRPPDLQRRRMRLLLLLGRGCCNRSPANTVVVVVVVVVAGSDHRRRWFRHRDRYSRRRFRDGRRTLGGALVKRKRALFPAHTTSRWIVDGRWFQFFYCR